MAEGKVGKRQIRGFCRLCIARCGTIATVEDGKFVRLDPDPSHPTGSAICAKGRAAPELVYSKARLTRPLRRKSPKGVANAVGVAAKLVDANITQRIAEDLALIKANGK